MSVREPQDRERCPPLPDLLRAVEGELPPARLALITVHLRTCAACRSQIEDTETFARRVAQRLRAGLTTEVPDDFSSRFEAQLETQAHAARLSGVSMRRWLPVAAMVPLLVAAWVFSRTHTAVVRADELLMRAAAEERAIPADVVRRVRIHVTPPPARHDPESLTPLTVTRDLGGTAGNEVAGQDAPAPLTRLLRAHHFDWQHPLSVAAFHAWRASLARKHDRVTVTGDLFLTLHTTTPDGVLRDAQLTVRRDTYRAVRQTLVFDGLGSVEVEELSQSVRRPELETRHRAPSPPVDALSARPDVDALQDAELDARLVLRDVGLDVRGVGVARARTAVRVEGEVATPAQQDAIVERLAGVPHVHVVLRLPKATAHAETAPVSLVVEDSGAIGATDDGLPLPVLGLGTVTGTLVSRYGPPLAGVAPPVHTWQAAIVGPAVSRWLDRTFQNSPDMKVTYIADLLRCVSAVRQRLVAMQALAARYPADEVGRLSPGARAKLQRLIDSHHHDLIGELEAVERGSAALIGTRTRDIPREHPPTDWQVRVAQGITRQEALEQRLLELLTCQDLPILPASERGEAPEPEVVTNVREAFAGLWDVVLATPVVGAPQE